MALSDIEDKIIKDAKAESARLLGEARAQKEEIDKETREEKERLTADEEAYRETTRALNARRIESAARAAGRMKKSAMRRELLDTVFGEVVERLRGMDDASYANVLDSFIQGLPTRQTGVLYVPKERRELAQELVKKSGLSCTVAEGEDLAGGARFETDTEEYDLDFARLVEQKRPHLEPELARIIFS